MWNWDAFGSQAVVFSVLVVVTYWFAVAQPKNTIKIILITAYFPLGVF